MKAVLCGLVLLSSFSTFAQVASNDGSGIFDKIGEVSGKNVHTITIESQSSVLDRNFTLQEMKDQCESKFKQAVEKIHSISNAVIVNSSQCRDHYLPEYSYTHVVKGEIRFIR